MQAVCFAETDGEADQLNNFRKSDDDGLEVRFRVCHKGTVIS